jgi:hypothetical protein
MIWVWGPLYILGACASAGYFNKKYPSWWNTYGIDGEEPFIIIATIIWPVVLFFIFAIWVVTSVFKFGIWLGKQNRSI